MPSILLLTLTAIRPLAAQTPEESINRALATLASLSVRENISRFVGTGATGRKLDSFETEVSVADGIEQYSDIRGKHHTYRHFGDISGLWSFGEIVTMLRTTRDLIDDAESILAEETPTEEVVTFRCRASKHQWFVTVQGRVHWLDFDGVVRISRETDEIERLTWMADAPPKDSGIAAILWDVDFYAANVAGVVCTMPSESVFRIVRSGPGHKMEWNLTRYAALGRYGSEASVRYER